MNPRLSTLALAVAALAPLAAQQTAVFPSDHASNAGFSSERNLPLAAGISRTQMIFQKWDLGITPGRRITEVGFRQDETRTSTGVALQLEIWMGGNDMDIDEVSGTFDSNFRNGTPSVKVFGPSIVRLPDLTGTNGTQDDFFITLDTPYTVQDENLVVEYRVLANANANQAFNYYLDRADHRTTVTEFGQGCQSSAGTTPSLSAFDSAYLGGDVFLQLRSAPGNSLVWFNLSVRNQSPIDLTPFGAPGCTALVFPDNAAPRTGSPSGTASLNFPLPEEPAFLRQHLYAQVLVFDLFANNLGFVASNGVDLELGIKPGMNVVSSNTSATATTGTNRRRYGVISLFRHRQ